MTRAGSCLMVMAFMAQVGCGNKSVENLNERANREFEEASTPDEYRELAESLRIQRESEEATLGSEESEFDLAFLELMCCVRGQGSVNSTQEQFRLVRSSYREQFDARHYFRFADELHRWSWKWLPMFKDVLAEAMVLFPDRQGAFQRLENHVNQSLVESSSREHTSVLTKIDCGGK